MKRKGKGTGLNESIVGAGALSGPVLGGIAAQFAGLRAPYLLCLVVLFVAVIVEICLLKRNNTNVAESRIGHG
jgi:MFS family permease